MILTEVAKAKINLSLSLSGRKIDGFHDLASFICFSDFSDKLNLKNSDCFSYKVNSTADINPTDDLVLKVIYKIKEEFCLKELPKVDLVLEKNIPIGAGLGGGSSDAAATIRLMNKFLNLGMSKKGMCDFGKSLGSDIPACILSKPLIAYGRGEKLIDLDFKTKYHMLVIYPNIEISTKEIFNLTKISRRKDLNINKIKESIESYSSEDNESIMSGLANDLQEFAFEAYPILGDIIYALNLNKSFFSRMSGSGSACFGLFHESSIDRAKEKIAKKYPNWMIKKALLNDL